MCKYFEQKCKKNNMELDQKRERERALIQQVKYENKNSAQVNEINKQFTIRIWIN